MGKILDLFTAAGRQVEAEIAAKAGATGPRGPQGPKGATGPQGPPGPTGDGSTTTAKYDLLTAADGHATGFAKRHGISFDRLKVLNPAGPPSGDWNLVHVGERYRYA